MTAAREAKLARRAAEVGWHLEKGEGGFRLVDASTGTWVAAEWLVEDGYGLTLDDIEVALSGSA